MRSLLLLFLVLPAVVLILDKNSSPFAFAKDTEDPLEDEEEADVEGEIDEITSTEPEDYEPPQSTASPDADTTLLFVKPPVASGTQIELPAGRIVEFLVGFRNNGDKDFVVELLEASFRYPMDFSFYIQNFSTIAYNRDIAPSNQITLQYTFVPSETFAGRPFGLNINLMYRDAAGNRFQEALFNETINVVEIEEGLDGETFFLYLFLAGGIILLLVIGQQTMLSVGRKRSSSRKAPVETGTDNPNNVDYEWLPKQTLMHLNKDKAQRSPKSPKQSPRQRKAQRKVGSE